MAAIVSYRDLEAWKAAMNLLLATYAVARQLPQTERFELSAQMRRAAVSVPSNIAEGQATGPGGRYRHHVRIALGSLAELDTELEAVRRLEYSSEEALRVVAEHLAQTGRLLHGLDRSLRRRHFAISWLTLCGLFCFGGTLLLS
jgi:four helix bundle protein